MWKIQIFIFVEAVLLTLAAITILSIDFSRFVVLMVLFLLLLYYYFGKQKANFLLIALSVLLFFIVMLNPFVIAAILFAVVYGLLIAYPYMYKENEAVVFDVEEDTKIRQEKTRWIGDLQHFSKQSRGYRDLNVIRVFGNDTLHLEEVAICNWDNVVIIRKGFGNTKIILPIDLELHLQINTLYGDLKFLDLPVRKMRNETIDIETAQYRRSHRSIKIVVVGIVGDVEVIRA